MAAPAWANPVGGEVKAGQATISGSGNALNIHQTSDRAVIDWRGFDIAPGETTRFEQPSSSSHILNRVNSTDPSRIMGRLTANGNITLINPNGVFFGKGSKVDVNGLIATTADIDNDRFMRGDLKFDKSGNPDASVINEGTITTREAGLVGLVAPQVENRGVIQAKMGRVQLASGDTATIDLYGNGLVELAVSDKMKRQLVSNSGRIEAEGGSIALTAAAGKEIVNSLITVSGELKAPTISRKNGKIIITGTTDAPQTDSLVTISGHVAAAGQKASEKGGEITITGDKIALTNKASVDASGKNGGGTVKIGGDYQGKGSLPNARKTYIGKDATINVNANDTGNGGKAIVWADDSTQFYGTIHARGGNKSGDGGFVEVSGKQTLSASGQVFAGASHGKAGQWLLDPNNITIQTAGPDTNVTATPNFTSTDDNAIVTTGSIVAALNGGTDVTIQTAAVGANSQNGDITVNNSISKTGGGTATLRLNAHNNIIINNANITSTAGALNIILNADTDQAITPGGAISITNSTITTNGGNFTAGGGANPLTGYATGNVSIPQGIRIQDTSLSTGAGAITMRGRGYSSAGTGDLHGIWVHGTSVIQSAMGDINMYGEAGAGDAPSNDGWGNLGIYIGHGNGVASTVTSQDGDILLSGIAGTGNTSWNTGVVIYRGSGVQSTGTGAGAGNITITGVSSGTQNINQLGFSTEFSSTNAVRSVDGDITISGTSSRAEAGSWGIDLRDSSIVSTGDGIISLTGQSDPIAPNIRMFSPTVSIGSGTASGDITLIADSYNFVLDPTIQTTGNVYIKPRTATTSIGLGGGFGTLQLSDSVLANISAGTKLVIGDSAAGTGDIDLDSWNLGTKNYAVEIYGNDIDIGGVTMGTGNFLAYAKDAGADVGDVTTSTAAITKSLAGASVLDLRADHSITVNQAITAIGAGILNTRINSDRNADQKGWIQVFQPITSKGGQIGLTGGNLDDGSNGGIAGDGIVDGFAYGHFTGAGSSDTGVFLSAASNISSGAGNIFVFGEGELNSTIDHATGIRQHAGNIQSTSGKITIRGYGGTSATNMGGMGFYMPQGLVTTTSGAIDIGVLSQAIFGPEQAMLMQGGATISSSGAGAGNGDVKVNVINQNAALGLQMRLQFGNNAYITSNGANIQVSANSAGAGVGFDLSDLSQITAGGSGNVTVATDKISFSPTADIAAGGNLTIKPYTASTSIGLGGGGGGLNLDDTTLSHLNAGTKLVIGDSVTGTGDIDLDSWNLGTKNYAVEIYGNDIDIGGITMGTGSFLAYAKDAGADKGDLNISANITRAVNGDATLDLRADQNITNSGGADIIATDANSDGDANAATDPDRLNVILNSDRNVNSNGSVTLSSSTITTLGGNIIAGGGVNPLTDYAWGESMAANQKYGIDIGSSSLNAGSGNISLHGHGQNNAAQQQNFGIGTFNTVYTTTGEGNITMDGISGDSAYTACCQYGGFGLFLQNADMNVVGGDISLTGRGASVAGIDHNYGIKLFSGSQLASTGTGAAAGKITLNGTGGNGANTNAGVRIDNAGTSISSVDGDISITG